KLLVIMDSHSKIALSRYNCLYHNQSHYNGNMLQLIGREGQTQYDWLVKLGIKLIFNVNIKALGLYEMTSNKIIKRISLTNAQRRQLCLDKEKKIYTNDWRTCVEVRNQGKNRLCSLSGVACNEF